MANLSNIVAVHSEYEGNFSFEENELKDALTLTMIKAEQFGNQDQDAK